MGAVKASNMIVQILEMDEDEDDREFSRGIVFDFFDQAQDTFRAMEADLYTQP